MRVLLTGGTGQVGQALIATAPAWAEIVAPSRAQLDLADPDSIGRALDLYAPECVINAAAYTAVDRAESEPELAWQINARAVSHIAARAPRLVQISTDFVFGGETARPRRPTDPATPLSVYGASKRGGEEAALAHPRALIVRTAWVYLAFGSNFVSTVLKLIASRPELSVVADQIGTPTHARGLARAVWTLIDKGPTDAAAIHHWTDAGAASWYDFAVTIQEEALALGLLQKAAAILPIRTEDYPTPAKRPPYSLLDKTDTWAITGRARHWRAELRDCLGQMVSHPASDGR